MSDNLRGILLMIASMAGFAVEDVFIKTATATLPTGQILIMLGLVGAAIFAVPAARQGAPFLSRDVLHPAIMARNFGEMVGAIGFVTALALTPLSTTSAILQATPLLVTLGAAVFLREPVGWRRWSAILVGFVGVLMILRPGMAGFLPASIFAVLAAIGIAVRDLATRRIPATVSTMWISSWGFMSVVPAGIILLLVEGSPKNPTASDLGLLSGALVFGVTSYYAIVQSTRIGELAVVTPFRYSRLLFSLILGILIFDERPDFWTLAGAAIVIASGLYTLHREIRQRRLSKRPSLG